MSIVLTRLGLACGIAASCLVSGGLRAEEGVAFKNLMGNIGILPKEKDPIPYRERAPLVIPPKVSLPPPASSSVAANPQWPNDPDVASLRKRRDEERRPVTWSETRRMSDNNPILRPSEIQAGRVAAPSGVVPGSHRGDDARDVLYLSPDQMKAGTKKKDDTDVKTAAEPSRSALAEPPPGYRRPTNSNVKYNSAPRVDQQALDANPMTWLTRKFKGEDDE